MSLASIGDLSRTFHMRQANAATTKRLDQLTLELTSGRKSDLAASVGGDLTRANAIESRLTKIGGILSAATEAASIASAMQNSLEFIQNQAETLGGQMLSLTPSVSDEGFRANIQQAPQSLSLVISALNTSVGGRHIFGGTETSQPPLSTSEELLDDLRTELSGATTTTEIVARLNAWFEAPIGGAGYLDASYRGNTQALQPMAFSDGGPLHLSPNAASEGLRSTIKGLALGVLMGGDNLQMDNEMRSALSRQAGLWLTEGAHQTTQLRATLGQTEEAIARVATSAESERSVMRIAYNELTAVDPFETASRITETENQMQLLYTLTARLARLNLADYLR